MKSLFVRRSAVETKNSVTRFMGPERMEPRLMLAGDAVVAVEIATTEPSTSRATNAVWATNSEAATATVGLSTPRSIVFMDAEVTDFDPLLHTLTEDTEVVLLLPEHDPLTQISDILAARRDVKSIHIVSHGRPGELRLAGQSIDSERLRCNSAQLIGWRRSLTQHADILIYGCDVAAGHRGEQWMQTLAMLTNADVAASSDRTGAAHRGGDWVLEKTIGRIESPIVGSQRARDSYAGTLAINVFAAGATGDETMQLKIDGNVVAQWSNIGGDFSQREFQSFTFNADVDLRTSFVEVAFVNDLYVPGMVDRNLYVDRIEVDGVILEAEAANVLSTGTWRSNLGFRPGYLQTEMLHGNGSLRIGTVAAEPNTIVISAAGQTGEETMQLLINERVVRTWENIGGDFNVRLFNEYAFRNETPIDVDQVRIAFTNDAFVEGQLDRNLIVDQISIGGDVYQSEHPTTFSTGTWNEANRAAVPGRFQSEWLQQNGFLKFTDQSSPGIVDLEPGVDGSVISIRAKGDVGVERLDLWIDGRRATTFDVTDTLEIYQYAATGNVQANQIRVEYNTDERGLAVGRDANLTVDYIEIDGVRFETESNSTYSSGTGFIGTAVQFGFGHGESLYVNGFFQYEAVVIRDDAFSIAEDSIAVPLAILANDTVADGYTVTPQIVRDPENGVLQFTGGQWLYTPNAEFVGTDEFQYAITSLNGSRQLNSATVRIDVNQSHQQPQSQINPAIASELTPSGKSLILRKYVQLPLGENGRQPRMNAMATTGNRTFIVTDGSFDNEGLIFELVRDEDGNVRAELFMDVGAAFFGSTGLKIDNSSPLNGLRSVAFHPEFATNGKFYTSITSERPDDPSQHYYLSDTDTPVNVESVLVEWSVNVETGQFDPNSFREVFRVGMRNSEHSIRGITFNPFAQPGDEDYGLLYIGHGDGSEQSAISGDGQAGDALGKVLRVDPLATANKPFTSPESNPYFGLPWMIDEAYAIGFRNPHNLTFARDANGTVHLIVTEIGRDNIEEINIVRAGGNYGWADREGVFVHERERFEVNGNISLLPADEATRGLIYPVSMLGHEGTSGQTFVGQALAGGHVIQNGSPQLDDQFIFAEFGTDGRAYHIDFSDALQQSTTLDAADPSRDQPSDLTWLTPQELTILFDQDNDASTTPLVRASIRDVLDDEPEFEQVPSAGKIRADIRFGQGVDGELYVMNKRNGWVYLVTNTVVEIV